MSEEQVDERFREELDRWIEFYSKRLNDPDKRIRNRARNAIWACYDRISDVAFLPYTVNDIEEKRRELP